MSYDRDKDKFTTTVQVSRHAVLTYDEGILDALIDLEFQLAKDKLKQEVRDARRNAEHRNT